MKDQNSFKDPIRKPWVGFGIFILFLAMVPVWPITGNWFGIPAWAVFAVSVSILASLFTAFVIVRVWRDPDEMEENND
ncbi:MAG: hypothetical protein F3743_00775 [Nitrospinae bacterium]|nr:hypothetical protein [Nitrospinota bacterium]MZH03918.1 hypothetical protein [Nitrospinota bacterium]MZH13894.1 hypothetical protein [Nitrospinota bacterium]